MNSNIHLTDFENLLILKNQLITLSTEKLKETYNNMSDYILFIDTAINMLNEESAFLYLDDSFPAKIKDVIQIHRFDIKNNEIIDAINDLTICLNDIENTSSNYKKMLLTSYIEYQKNARDSNFATMKDFFNALAYDSIVFLYLKGVMDIPNRDDDLMFSSLSYMIEVCPHFFIDKSVYNIAYDELNNLYNNSKVFDFSTRLLTSRQKKKLKNIGLKEE